MSSDRSHTCCVIFPVRVGVFITSTLFLICATLFSFAGWYGALHRGMWHLALLDRVLIVLQTKCT
jgi:hypothetical protein